MLDIEKRIKTISKLIEEDTDQSLTYAALECRLTIEYICFERFKMFYSYLSPKDLKKWQPKHVVQQVSDDISNSIASEVTLSFCKVPEGAPQSPTIHDYESREYKEIGTQKALKLSKMHKLWNSLSNIGLHLQIPNISENTLSLYGDKDSLKKKANEVLDLLNQLKTNNLLIGGCIEPSITMTCEFCETVNKKPLARLNHKDTLSCINPDCDETYLLTIEDGNHFFERKTVHFKCTHCEKLMYVPVRKFDNMKFNKVTGFRCPDCTSVTNLILHPAVIAEDA